MNDIPPQVRQQIVSAIRSGGFAHVAAEAAGVPCDLFMQWLEEGSKADAVEPFAGFAADVRQALAQARLAAEIAAFQKDPKAWLEHGPGRETRGNPGWTGVVQASADDDRELDVFAQPAVIALLREVTDAIAEHPDVSRKVAHALNKQRPSNGNLKIYRRRIA